MSCNGFLDAHLHLQDSRLRVHLDRVMYRAQSSGVDWMLCNATREDDWGQVIRIAKRFPSVIPYLGVHPWYADQVTKGWQQRLTELVELDGCGIGEIGLDKFSRVTPGQQEKVFAEQLQVAVHLKRPVSIHCVRRWGALLNLLDGFGRDFQNVPLMVHSFGGSGEIMKSLVDKGIYISFSMGMLHPAREKLREVFRNTPADRLLLETDSPEQGMFRFGSSEIPEVNEPGCIVELYRQAALLKEMAPEELRTAVYSNGTRFFSPAASVSQ